MDKEKSLEDILREMPFCELRRYDYRLFRVKDSDEGIVIQYYCCKIASPYMPGVMYNESKQRYMCNEKIIDGNDISQCPSCEKVVYKYIIFNLDNEYVREPLANHVYNDFEAFSFFQQYNISDMFFGEHNYVRFNTYINAPERCTLQLMHMLGGH